MAGKEVAEAKPASVPALAPTPSIELSAEDVALPTIKLGQFMSDHVQEDRVPAGSIFSATSADDPDPVVLWEQGSDELLKFYVLAMRKGKSISDGGELVLFSFDDPDAPADAWVTYNYVIALPSVDEEIPYKFLLTRTGKPAAQQINTVIAKNLATPAYNLAFTVDCVQRENKKGKFFVPRIRHVEADEAEVKIAEALATMVAGDTSPAAEGGTDEPAI
jgi:hypothetical protein